MNYDKSPDIFLLVKQGDEVKAVQRALEINAKTGQVVELISSDGQLVMRPTIEAQEKFNQQRKNRRAY
jgi:hypothetical protein